MYSQPRAKFLIPVQVYHFKEKKKGVTMNPLLGWKKMRQTSATYRDISVYVIFLAVFSDESTSEFINSGRYDLKPFVRFSEDRFQSSYLQFQII